MKLICYKDKKGNIGDDLNFWIWPKIFGSDFFKDKKNAFLGIGSILITDSDYIEKAEKHELKIVFGTGVRSIEQVFDFDSTWDISFLRGPFSSYIVTGSLHNYITDSAYFISLLPEFNNYKKFKKKHKISFIPYYKSVGLVDWEKCCEKLGWNLILPTGGDVEDFLIQVAESENVIAEAMHGAIIADALRVPWKRLKFNAHLYEGEIVSEFKWKDWLYSINTKEHTPITFLPNILKTKYKIFPFLKKDKYIRDFVSQMKGREIKFSLSSDHRFDEIIQQLEIKKKEIIKKYL